MLSIQALVLTIFLTFFGINAYLLTHGVRASTLLYLLSLPPILSQPCITRRFLSSIVRCHHAFVTCPALISFSMYYDLRPKSAVGHLEYASRRLERTHIRSSLAFASSTAWLPLLYGTVVVSLTVYRTACSVLSKNTSEMLRVLLREGLLYYR